MSIDDVEESKGTSVAGEDESSQSSVAAEPEEEQGAAARVDAAKAFFRAMYAGDEPPPAFGNAAEQTAASSCKNCEGLEYSLREAEQKAAESEALYKRMAADFENYRRRMEREREEAVTMGVKKAAESFLPALDDLDRAIAFLTPETPADKTIESFQLVSNRIFSCLEQIGLKAMQSVGEPFDPKYHEPVQQIETTEMPDGHVLQELRRGYALYDKVIRPALVNVALNPNEAHAEAPAPKAKSEPAPSSESEEQVQPSIKEAAKKEEAIDVDGDTAEAATVYDLGDLGED